MRLNKSWKYVVTDTISVSVVWFIFNILRYHLVGYASFSSLEEYLFLPIIQWGHLTAVIVALSTFYYSGYYNHKNQKSRLDELLQTFYSSIFTSLMLFFIIVINDLPKDYTTYHLLLSSMFLLIFIGTYLPRMLITQKVAHDIHNRRKGFNTLVIGTGNRAHRLINELNTMKYSLGYSVVGCVEVEKCKRAVADNFILGNFNQIDDIIVNHRIEEIIIALESKDDQVRLQTVYALLKYNLPIKITPLKFDILSGTIRMNTIYATPLVDVSSIKMEEWQKNVKNSLDRVASLFVLVFLSPLFLYIIYRIKKESKGPIFFQQERVGYHGNRFNIIKFRSMYAHEVEYPPRLSNEQDERITPFGKTMRKYRLDELPQFWNVLKGEMSIVGPRPEQPYFINEIVKRAPFYILLHNLKPGITSWGMIKYGYATNVEEMIRRLEYDLIYLENCSLFIDLKILIYTIRTVFTGKGI